jgi:hypothetical protein
MESRFTPSRRGICHSGWSEERGHSRVTEIGTVTTLRIDLAWKGVAKGRVVSLFVPRLCGYQWSVGQLWVIFSAPDRVEPALLQTSACSRSQVFDPNGEAFLWLQARASEGAAKDTTGQ